MSIRTEPELIHAIVTQPDDLAPRLDYASFLEQNGQVIRAEFIRVDIAIRKPGARYVDLLMRQTELIEMMQNTAIPYRWQPPEKANAEECDSTLVNGMTEEVWLPSRLFLKYADDIFSTLPIKRVRLLDRVP